MDVTDTWFVGHGPMLAERAKTKEGLVTRKVGIVLLCNADGYPCRWHVVSGKTGDSDAMTDMVREVAQLSWIKNIPLVCDRSMGHTVNVEAMLKQQVHFVTALVRPEFDAYTTTIPHQAFADLLAMPPDDKQALEAITKAANDSSLTRISDDLFVLDLGLIERNAKDEDAPCIAAETGQEDRTVQAIKLGKALIGMIQSGAAVSYPAAGRTLGLTAAQAKKYGCLVNGLAASIVDDIAEGRVVGLSLEELRGLVQRFPDPTIQRPPFDDLAKQATARGGRPKRTVRPRPQVSPAPEEEHLEPARFRGVAYFVPELFLQHRRTAQRQLIEIREFEKRLNSRLDNPRSRMTTHKIAAALDRKLRSYNLVEAFDIDISTQEDDGRKRFKANVTLNRVQWARRRRYDGFCLLIAHPQVTMPATDLIALYRSKDLIEKDFQSIKSLIKLRPVHHQTDEKVRAHVSVCMLSLLLERTLRNKLSCSAKEAIELLSPCTLNRYGGAAYNVTEADKRQREILKRLKLGHLVEDDAVAEKLTPRDP
jgi:hypothetical protein